MRVNQIGFFLKTLFSMQILSVFYIKQICLMKIQNLESHKNVPSQKQDMQ